MKTQSNDPAKLHGPGPGRFFLLLLALIALADLTAQTDRYRPAPVFVAGGNADQAEGARILSEFRQTGITGTYWLAFDLQILPRKGAERTVKGQLFGTPGAQGPVTRLAIDGQTWLVEGGRPAPVWRSVGGAAAQVLTDAETLDAIAGTDLTIFDLQMPFLQWKDFVYEGLARVRGRPTHSYVLYPPAELASARPNLTGVRLYLDTQFKAILQLEMLGAKGATEKTVSILDLKKLGDQPVVKSIDFRNHLTRDKTRFTVTAVALDVALPPATFEPAGLAAESPAVPPAKIQRF